MELPKRFRKNSRTYILIKEYKNFGLYKEEKRGFRECFDKFDLGLLKQTVKPYKKTNPEVGGTNE